MHQLPDRIGGQARDGHGFGTRFGGDFVEIGLPRMPAIALETAGARLEKRRRRQPPLARHGAAADRVAAALQTDRERVVWGRGVSVSVEIGGGGLIQKKT